MISLADSSRSGKGIQNQTVLPRAYPKQIHEFYWLGFLKRPAVKKAAPGLLSLARIKLDKQLLNGSPHHADILFSSGIFFSSFPKMIRSCSNQLLHCGSATHPQNGFATVF